MTRLISFLAVFALAGSAILVGKMNERLVAVETALELCIAQSPDESCAVAEPVRLQPEVSPTAEALAPELGEGAEPPLGVSPPVTTSESAEASPATTAPPSFIADTRLHAVSQMMDLTEGEREALRAKFQTADKGMSTAEIIEEVLGREPAEHFRKQVRDVFSRVRQQAEDREVYYFTRTLALSPDQEREFRAALSEVERSVSEWGQAQAVALTPTAQLARIREERDLRATLMRERLKSVLDDSQYQSYLAEQSTSPAFELELFHEVPDDEEDPAAENAPSS